MEKIDNIVFIDGEVLVEGTDFDEAYEDTYTLVIHTKTGKWISPKGNVKRWKRK